eukprot:COSAG02_NODE_5612_length_4188_cov_45.782098_5_plen_61_part_00
MSSTYSSASATVVVARTSKYRTKELATLDKCVLCTPIIHVSSESVGLPCVDSNVMHWVEF